MGVGDLTRARWRAMLRVRRLQRAGDAMGCARELMRVGALTERIAKEAKMAKTHRSAVTGQFVSSDVAAADPDRHVAQSVRHLSRDARYERMSPAMLKIHVPENMAPGVFHLFTAPDHGPHHDHPWRFRSTVIYGGYDEELLHPDGRCEIVPRREGDSFEVAPEHVHRIVHLPAGECLTFIEVLGDKVQEPGFFEWRDGVMFSRRWFEAEFSPLT